MVQLYQFFLFLYTGKYLEQIRLSLRLTLVLKPRVLTLIILYNFLIHENYVNLQLYLLSLLDRDHDDNLLYFFLRDKLNDLQLLLLRLQRTTRELSVTTMRIRRIKLRANSFRASTIVLTLLYRLFVIYFISSLVHTIANLLRRLVNVTSGVVPTRVYAIRSLFQLLIYFTSSILTRTLYVSRHALRRITIHLMILRLFIRALIFHYRIYSLLTRLLNRNVILPRLLLSLVRRAIRLFNTVTTRIFFGLSTTRILQNRRDDFLPGSFGVRGAQ